VFDQELEFILFRRRCEGYMGFSAIVNRQYRHLAGLELGAGAALRRHEKTPDRVCVFVDPSDA
jgi:hypothetical protein